MLIPRWTIIADDLTGACDTGVAFTRRGWAARVAFTPEADFGSAPVRVVTTESRALAEDEAALAVARAVRALGLANTSQIYKKIDSTLRGHPGAELAAALRATGIRRALATPAFPGQGRLVRDGQVYVRDVLLQETELRREVAQPDMLRLFAFAGECRLVSLETVRDGVEQVVEILGQDGESPVVFVADAETDEDLRILARAAWRAGIHLFCGSAGLARALVACTPAPPVPEAPVTTVFQPRGGPVLAVAGSYSPVTLRQIEAARAVGITVICPPYVDLRIVDHCEARMIIEEIAHHLDRGKDVIICAVDLPLFPGAEQDIAAWLAALAAGAIHQSRIGGLVLTGGDTAAAVCRALGCAAIDLGGEVHPGVGWGRLADGPFAGLPVVTKAGGFGENNTLFEAIRFLGK